MQGDCIELMSKFDFKFDMIFADPPYFLSNGGISVQSGKMVSVNKGDWDKSRGEDADHAFNREWLKACREKLKSNGTIWISGTYHNIFSIAKNLRRYLGIDMCQDFLDLSIKRKNEIEDPVKREEILLKLNKQSELYQDKEVRVLGEEQAGYGQELPF